MLLIDATRPQSPTVDNLFYIVFSTLQSFPTIDAFYNVLSLLAR